VIEWGVRKSPGDLAFLTATVLMALLAAAAVAGVVALLAVHGLRDGLAGLPDNAWWMRYRDPGPGASTLPLWRIGAAAAAALVSIAAVLRIRVLYRREPSPILPFILVFLFSLGVECLRAGTAVLFALDGPVSPSILLTRVIYWGRFVGMLGLLAASLYCTELKYGKLFPITGVVFLVSLAMAASIPVDRSVFLAQLTWKLGDEQSMAFVNLAIGALTILAAAAAALTRGGPRFVLLAVGLAVLVGSRELEFFAARPMLLGAGIVAQAAGAVLCMRAFAREGGDGRRADPRPRAG
jgi:hypothetical protein